MPLPTIPDYSDCIKTPQMMLVEHLKGGEPLSKNNRLIRYSGGFCVVFPYHTATNKYAVRCWHAEIADAKYRTQIIAEVLGRLRLPYFVGFEYFEKGLCTSGGVQPLVVMDWVEAQPLKKFLEAHLSQPDVINRVAENFKAMVADLHQHHLSHGDLQHGNVLVNADTSLVLVDYDSMYVPELEGSTDEIKGLMGYQHEARWSNTYLSEKADYFSELVIYLSLRTLARYPELWNCLNMSDTDTLLFSKEDILSRGTASIFDFLRQDGELAPLVNKLCDFMQMPSIDDLVPLEEAVIPLNSRISTMWMGGNGYVASATPSPAKVVSANEISNKWGGGNGYVASANTTPAKVVSANEISNKWGGGNGYVKPNQEEEQQKISQSIQEKFKQ